MLRYGKMAQHAVASVSRLATYYAIPGRTTSSSEIARDCKISKALAAKILNTLAKYKVVVGSPGPGGGYRMRIPPENLSLFTVVFLFERGMERSTCPFGRVFCNGGTCVLHREVLAIQARVNTFLRKTTFAAFVGNRTVVTVGRKATCA